MKTRWLARGLAYIEVVTLPPAILMLLIYLHEYGAELCGLDSTSIDSFWSDETTSVVASSVFVLFINFMFALYMIPSTVQGAELQHVFATTAAYAAFAFFQFFDTHLYFQFYGKNLFLTCLNRLHVVPMIITFAYVVEVLYVMSQGERFLQLY